MTPQATQQIRALIEKEISAAGDNLWRARGAAKNADPSKPWGASGQTLQQIIDGYQEWQDRAKAALAEFDAAHPQ